MPYGTIKVDNVTFTNAGVDQSISVSGIVASISGNITATGTISGNIIRGGATVSGATVTGTAGQFGTVTGNTAGFTTVTGTTVTGTTANFVSGVFQNISGGTHTITSGVFASGTAAAPSITFTSDLDTGIYNSAANQVSITTSGTERLRVDATGQIESVSLGTAAAPAYSFTTDPDTGLYSPAANEVALATNGSGRLFVDSSGNVGVGVTPSAWSVGRALQIGNAANALFGATSSQLNLMQNATYDGDFKYVNTAAASYYQQLSGGHIWYTAASGTAGATATFFPRVCITNAGLVGVGTSSPSQPLSVNGNIKIQNSTASTKGFIFESPASLWGPQESGLYFIPADGENGRADFKISLWNGLGTFPDRFYINGSSGNVGIGSTSPDALLNTEGGTVRVSGTRTAGSFLDIVPNNTGSNGVNLNVSYYGSGSYGPLNFVIGGSQRACIDSSGRLLVGTSTARSTFFGTNYTSALQVETASVSNPNGLSIGVNTNDDNPANLYLFKTRGTSVGSNTAVQNGDVLGSISFIGANGTDVSNTAAWIRCIVDGAPFSSGDTTDLPGALVFSTTKDGQSSPTEAFRIDSAQRLLIGTTNTDPTVNNVAGIALSATQSQLSADSSGPLLLNRKTNDGTLVSLRQDGTEEGTISVSGTTVSYNGAHLSRWSQLPSGQERTEILRGTILSNVDEMCEWGDEDNEQLNRMKVSDVEGDKNVSGVFQAWDDDDDTYINDFYCAMTGDFIIRIGAGVTVERGDLLMSAGDGTAKPQDDDIIRSKTIAKVTSTNVSCTYPDGSYCVPCVLMAC